MITPYDWQEGIGNRAQYIEGKLRHGSPVLAVSLDAGILVYTRRRQSRKIYEIYDRLVFAAIGQQSDVEALRTAAIEFAHQEGYNRSEQDVTIQRVVTALSGPVKKAFADFSTSPLVARSIFAEVGDSIGQDRYYLLDYDGDYRTLKGNALIVGADSAPEDAQSQLDGLPHDTQPDIAVSLLGEIWSLASRTDEDDADLSELSEEAVLVERSSQRENRFKTLTKETNP